MKFRNYLGCCSIPVLALTLAAAPAQAQDAPAADAASDVQAAPADAPAQDDSAQSGQPVEEVVVTGSSIRGAPPVGSNLVSVGQDAIQSTPAQSVQQILKSVPLVSGLNSAGQGAFQSNDASGMSAPSIHGLGGSASSSTLVIIDGHRFPLGGVIHGLADPNLLPSNAIERVEVLADGASSVYGSDAVAGVINFITRRKFDGIEVSGQMGFGDQYKTANATLLAGTSWDSGNAFIAVSHSYRANLSAGDRDFTQADHRSQGGSNLATFACQPASIQNAGSSLIYLYLYASSVSNAQVNAPCDYTGLADLLPQEVRNNGMIKVTQEVGKATVTVDAVYSKRDNVLQNSRGSVQATIFGPGSGKGTQINPFFTAVGGSAATSQTVRLNFDDLLGPGARTEAGAEDFYVHGKVDYPIDDNWHITANAVFGINNSYAYNLGGVCSSCVTLALNGTTNGGGNLTTPSVPATGVTVTQALTTANALDPYNPLGTNRTNLAVLQAMTDTVDNTFTRQSIQDGTLQIGGSLFHLPAGEVKVSVGGEVARYTIDTERTIPLNIGPSSAGSSVRMLNFPNRTVTSAYAEALVPVIGPEMHVPLIRELTINVSGRIDKYSDVGTTRNPRIGANWEVFEGVKLRANWARSFVAPQVVYLGVDGNGLNAESRYTAATQVVTLPISEFPDAASFPGCAPPATTCTLGTGLVTGLRLAGGRPLEPQKGKTWSIGVDLKPVFLPGFRASVTLWNNQMIGGITSPTEALSVGTPNLHDRFTLFPGGATAAQIAAVVGNVPQQSAIPANVYYIYDFRIGNVLNLYVKGLDVEASYSFDTGIGKFGIGGSMSKLLKFEQQTGDGARFSIMNTSGFNSTFPSIEWQGRANLSYESGGFSFDGYLNYVGAYRNYSANTVKPIIRDSTGSPIGGGDRVSPYASIDVHASYNIPGLFEKAQVFVDATNLFARDPSFFNSPNGYDQFSGNPIGRVVTIGFRTAFR